MKESPVIPQPDPDEARSVLEEMTSLMIAVPDTSARSPEVAAWYQRKASLLDRIAAEGGPDAEFVRGQAIAAHRHAARLRHDAA
jgi:hypothetical protein